jgi:hypothetical protein
MPTKDPIDARQVTEIGAETCAALGFETRSAIGSAGVFPPDVAEFGERR